MRLHAMDEESGSPSGGSVRTLAREARRVVSGGSNRADAEQVLRRIDSVRREWVDAPSAPIHRWLDSLERQVARP